MTRIYYYEKMQNQREREILQEVAARNLLKDGGHEALTAQQALRLVLRVAPVLIVVSILLFILLD
jgi:hypothetical protein